MSAGYGIVLWPLLIYFAAVLALTGAILSLSYVLGERHREAETVKPYESGIVSTGSARVRFDVKFYQNAMYFVIFDLEAVFIFAWALTVRQSGWTGYGEIVIFIAVLGTALAFLWREGQLDWGPRRQRRLAAPDARERNSRT